MLARLEPSGEFGLGGVSAEGSGGASEGEDEGERGVEKEGGLSEEEPGLRKRVGEQRERGEGEKDDMRLAGLIQRPGERL